MTYQTGYSADPSTFEDAARLTQRLAPLALAYCDLYLIRKGKYGKLPDPAREQLAGVKERLAEACMRDVLDFIGHNPFGIPRQ